MKLLTSFISLTLLSNIAFAHDMHRVRTESAQFINNWSGLYGGVNAGVAFNHADLNANHLGLTDASGTCHAATKFSTFFPGVQIGYLQQLDSNFALGVEGDLSFNMHKKHRIGCNCPVTPTVVDTFSIQNKMQGSLRGRFGYVMSPEFLPFLSAGASFADVGMTYHNEGTDYYSTNKTEAGWLVGGGVEWGFKSAWSLRAEYYYIDYGKMDLRLPTIYSLDDPNGRGRIHLKNNNVRIALNHWF